MKNGEANNGSGKTQFNRAKAKGQSWVELRDKAVKAGQFRIKEKREEKGIKHNEKSIIKSRV